MRTLYMFRTCQRQISDYRRNSLKYQGISTKIPVSDISIKTFRKAYLDHTLRRCINLSQDHEQRHRCIPSKHLFRSYIFYKEYLLYIVYLRGSIGPSMTDFKQISPLRLLSQRKSSACHTLDGLFRCEFVLF